MGVRVPSSAPDLHNVEALMEVLNKVVNGLERRYSVLVSIEELNAAMESRLKEAARKIRLDGFRPGNLQRFPT